MTKPIKIKEWNGEKCNYATAKLDGNWLTLSMTEDGLRAFTSLPTDVTDKVSDFDWFQHAIQCLNVGEELWGEAWVPGRPASDVRSWPGNTRFTAFAVPHLGETRPLEDVQQWCLLNNIDFTPFLRWEATEHSADEYWSEQTLLGMARSAGYEGWVLKHYHLAYWYKLKETLTADLLVKSLKDGKGKFLGLVGSLTVIDSTGREVADVGGFTDEERIAIGPNDIGRVVEVAYQYVGSKGKLRHPRFMRWRDDKSSADVSTIEAPAQGTNAGDESFAQGEEY